MSIVAIFTGTASEPKPALTDPRVNYLQLNAGETPAQAVARFDANPAAATTFSHARVSDVRAAGAQLAVAVTGQEGHSVLHTGDSVVLTATHNGLLGYDLVWVLRRLSDASEGPLASGTTYTVNASPNVAGYAYVAVLHNAAGGEVARAQPIAFTYDGTVTGTGITGLPPFTNVRPDWFQEMKINGDPVAHDVNLVWKSRNDAGGVEPLEWLITLNNQAVPGQPTVFSPKYTGDTYVQGGMDERARLLPAMASQWAVAPGTTYEFWVRRISNPATVFKFPLPIPVDLGAVVQSISLPAGNAVQGGGGNGTGNPVEGGDDGQPASPENITDYEGTAAATEVAQTPIS